MPITEIPAQEPGVKNAPAAHTSRKWVLAALVVAVLGVVGIFVRVHSSGKATYVTARLSRGNIESTVTTTGNLNAVITVQVGSQVSGNIIALYADFNTKVKKGQLVAEIDPAPFKAAVDQAAASLNAAKAAIVTAQAMLAKSKSDLATAEANVASQKANVVKAQSAVDLARVENERRQGMVKTGSTSQEDADTAQANYDQAVASIDAVKAGVNAAESAAESARKGVDVAQTQLDQAKAVVAQDQAILAQAQLNLDHTRILAPVDGTVESRNMDVGQTVAASFQAPVIFLIAQDLTKMQVDTNVDESDVGRVQLDQQATFTVDAWPGRVFRGRVAQIRQAPINVQNVITYDVVIQVSNEDLKLFPGMTANVTVAVGRAANVLKLPKAALRFHPRAAAGARQSTQQTQIVSVLDAVGQLKQIPVKLGMSDANYVEIVSGDLTEGQQVVVGMAGPAAQQAATPSRAPGRTGF
ncbi:MAG: efflux RND transporter periplasmic adaptor subunit [Bryobacteraceae bacterium]